MAAPASNTYDAGRGWTARVAERNTELMAQQPLRRRGMRTPEVYFPHRFDNSRLIKAPDLVRTRQMRHFGVAVAALFVAIMGYGLLHFSAIESGYRVEADKQTLDQLREENRQLRLNEAQLTEPARIDRLARELGMTDPQPGQVIHAAPVAVETPGAPTLAQAAPPAPIVP